MASRLFLSRTLPNVRTLIHRPLVHFSSTSPTSPSPLSPSIPLEELPISDTTPKRTIQRFLEPRLGITGTWTLGLGILTALISKEYIILHPESVLVVIDLAIIIAIYRKFGHKIADYLDGQIKEVKDLLYKERHDRIANLEDKIEVEGQTEDTLSVRHDLYELEKETNQLALQVEYQKRQETVNKEVKNRLEYQLQLERFQRKFEQELLVDWLTREVISSITPEQERATLTQCISTLKSLSSPL